MGKIVCEDYENIISHISIEKCSGRCFLITGATGFLGSWLVNVLMYLNEKGIMPQKCYVIAMCRNRDKAFHKFSQYMGNENFEILEQRVEEPIRLLKNIDYIIHAASIAVTSHFNDSAADVLTANIIGMYQLLEFSKSHQVKAVLFLSSGAVYGKEENEICEICEDDFFRLDFTKLENCYAEAKRVGEMLCKAYYKQYHVPAKTVRISHTYGPGIDIQDGRVFSDFVKNILNGEDLIIKGTGLDSRPFCYISDAVIAFFKILFDGIEGEAYNMANSQQTVTISELAEILTETAFQEKKLKVQYLNGRVTTPAAKKIIVNTDKLFSLGWQPQIDIVEGFRRTVDSFQSDQN